MNPPFKRYPLIARLLLILGLCLVNYVLFPGFAVLMVLPLTGLEHIKYLFTGNFTSDIDRYIFLFIQGFSSLGIFAFTAVLFSQLEAGFVSKHLGIHKKPVFKFVVLAILAIIVSQFFIDFLVRINQSIPLPEQLKFILEKNENAERVTEALVAGTSFIQFVVKIVVIALIPAIGEEFLFRGLLLGDLLKSKIHPAFAIIVTGFIFSITHAYFENTIAIWILGSFLGYLYYVSGSLWLPIAAHFVNNFLAVLLKYLFNIGVISSDLAEAKTPLYTTIISLLVFALFIFLFNKWKNPATFVGPEEIESSNETISE